MRGVARPGRLTPGRCRIFAVRVACSFSSARSLSFLPAPAQRCLSPPPRSPSPQPCCRPLPRLHGEPGETLEPVSWGEGHPECGPGLWGPASAESAGTSQPESVLGRSIFVIFHLQPNLSCSLEAGTEARKSFLRIEEVVGGHKGPGVGILRLGLQTEWPHRSFSPQTRFQKSCYPVPSL